MELLTAFLKTYNSFVKSYITFKFVTFCIESYIELIIIISYSFYTYNTRMLSIIIIVIKLNNFINMRLL